MNLRKPRKLLSPFVLALILGALPWGGSALAQLGEQEKAAAPAMTPEAKEVERAARMKLASTALEKLYAIQPAAREGVEKSAGYAVFDITAIYAILFVGQKGKGVLIDNTSKQPTYMTSVRAGTGPGVGKQRVYQIFVFKTVDAMNQFTLTGGTGGDLTATSSAGGDGFVRSFNPSIDIYQIQESGMALQASWGGTVYSKDSELN